MKRMMKNEVILEAKDLTIGYKHKHGKDRVLFENLSFKLHLGDFVTLLGPNGVGKSTLLRTLSGTQQVLSGNLYVNGKSLMHCSERERSKLVGVVFTDKTQTGGLTVSELVALGRQPYTGFLGRLSRHDKERIVEAMTSVGIAHKANCYMAELSDGERQKVMIAKAIVQECPLILLDEPTAFLDVVSRIEILTLLRNIALDECRTILLSSHDIDQSLVISDKLILLSEESGLTFGITEDLILKNKMNRLFLSDKVAFDTVHGIFYPKVNWSKKIVVSAKDAMLYHWVVNFFNRKGYACFLNADECGDDDALMIVAEDKNNLVLRNRCTGEEKKCSSFEEMVEMV